MTQAVDPVAGDHAVRTPPGGESVRSLEAKGLAKSYRGRAVVKGVSLDVRAGEVVGLLGPNGAGKTTIFDMVVGLTRPDEGTIELNGESVAALPMYRRARLGIGYLPQESSVFRRLTVEENILAVLELLDLPPERLRSRLQTLLKELDLTELRRSKAYALSGGERRRLEITRALVTRPQFLLLDEPFAGIDPIAVGDIQKIVIRLKEKGIGILITDHNVQETLSITDRAYIINEGRILEAGPPDVIVKSPKARSIYLGERFRL
ncbi:MAG: LPS export ABC transporter ATP-binding protein [Nitrospira sp.]|nr:MAG: LPS export ABC transporter ATP-binding protein [Nitrospira sp.]